MFIDMSFAHLKDFPGRLSLVAFAFLCLGIVPVRIMAQADKAMANIKTLIEEAGGSLEDIVKVVVYLTDIRYREPVYAAMGRWLRGVYPVSTGLVVSALARPEWLVEIDATAVLAADPRAERA